MENCTSTHYSAFTWHSVDGSITGVMGSYISFFDTMRSEDIPKYERITNMTISPPSQSFPLWTRIRPEFPSGLFTSDTDLVRSCMMNETCNKAQYKRIDRILYALSSKAWVPASSHASAEWQNLFSRRTFHYRYLHYDVGDWRNADFRLVPQRTSICLEAAPAFEWVIMVFDGSAAVNGGFSITSNGREFNRVSNAADLNGESFWVDTTGSYIYARFMVNSNTPMSNPNDNFQGMSQIPMGRQCFDVTYRTCSDTAKSCIPVGDLAEKPLPTALAPELFEDVYLAIVFGKGAVSRSPCQRMAKAFITVPKASGGQIHGIIYHSFGPDLRSIELWNATTVVLKTATVESPLNFALPRTLQPLMGNLTILLLTSDGQRHIGRFTV